MTTRKSANKVRGLCLFLLCLHLTVADVPGPCRYSVRKDHLATVRRLIQNQLKNGCSITYTFTERGSLSDTCYIRAAFPQILDLIDTHLKFDRGSDNGHYVEVMKALINNMYLQMCIPPINEELEDDPEKFSKTNRGSPREALERALEVFSLYLELMSSRNIPVDWSCDEEYAKDEPQLTTPLTQTPGAAECTCINPSVDYMDSHQGSKTGSSPWKLPSQTTGITSFSTGAPGQAPLLLGTTDPTAGHFTMGGHRGVMRVIDVSVSTTDLEERSASTASGSSRDPTQSTSGTPKFVTDSPVRHALFGPRIATIYMGRPPTPVPLQEVQVEGTPRRPKASAAVPLAKRSVEPRQDRSQVGLFANPAYPHSGTTSATQLPPGVSMTTPREKAALGAVLDHFSSSEKTWQGDGQTGSPKPAPPSHAPNTWLGDGDGVGRLRGLSIPAIRPSPSPDPEREALTQETSNKEAVGSADPPGQDTRTHFQSGDPEGSHDSNMLVYIVAPVCGGLLFIGATVYCLRRQKNIQDFLQSSQMTENQRLALCSTGLELQDCQAMTQPCLKSSSSGQL
ncbi:hypothetical protein SKAU_G00109500 [Synaphobranchus kaupii]|uniref:Uncharacterized protein n=1 Tax=Synaphobranchus kaupii TaxID=118154 RepID=A0A9Q1J768_SYNKA|nr:hypothetical protein SKAU_G00109500 [Synaphobranchus kaupii]